MQQTADFGSSPAAFAGRSNVRPVMVGVGIVWLVLTLGFSTQASWITWMWPWADAEMTYVFIASITAAVGVPMLWIALIDEPAAVAGLSIDGAMIGLAISLSLIVFWLGDRAFSAAYWIGPAISVVVMLAIFRRFHPMRLRDDRPMPRLLRAAFVVYLSLLWPVSAMLFLRVDNIFPWDLLPRTSTMIGAMFFGATASFAYALYRNSWVMAGGAQIGFLAYNVVLVIPYLRMIPRIGDDAAGAPVYGSYAAPGTSSDLNGISLTIYLATISVSTIVAIYYFFVRRDTSVWPHLRASAGRD